MPEPIFDLLKEIPDQLLRAKIEREAKKITEKKKYGLVFEQHIPEVTLLPNLSIITGARVVKRAGKTDEIFTVSAILSGSKARISREGTDEEETVKLSEIVGLKRFGEPIYPTLVPVDSVTRAPGKPYHTLINADNYHALQLLRYCYEGQVDVIYIDPPYNTGARDWKYNNNYVDTNDPWRHSKWLSFMDKRLRLAKSLLKPDGVVIVTIDEHEIHSLGFLLEEMFPNARRQLVTIVSNAAGVTQGGFYRVEEYALFCFMGDAKPVPSTDDLLSDENKVETTTIWFSLIRYGGINALPSKRPGLVYPIAVDPKRNRIVGVGKTLKQRVESNEVSGNLDAWKPDPKERINGYPVLWPFRGNGALSTWQLAPEQLLGLAKEGFVRIREQSNGPGGNICSITYVKSGNRKKIRHGEIPTLGREPEYGALIFGQAERNVIPKTVWKRLRHDAGKWGSRTIREVLGNVSFDYAKSPYLVLDTLAAVVGNKPSAVVLDFFAGSGTTLHSTIMLNEQDGGSRKCILITNNEVSEKVVKDLREHGILPGTAEFERHGICESITWPRCKFVINGLRDDGTELQGEYMSGSSMREGFKENLQYFKLEFLDPNAVAYGESFEAILPILWFMAGARDEIETARGYGKYFIPKHSPYAVLIKEDAFAAFKRELVKRTDVTHVFLITDSEEAYREMLADLPGKYTSRMLYKSYLDNFKINLEPST